MCSARVRQGVHVFCVPLPRPPLTFCLLNPGSTTYTMPSMVSDVSAMLVLTTTFRPGGPPGYLGPASQAWGGGAIQDHVQRTHTEHSDHNTKAESPSMHTS